MTDARASREVERAPTGSGASAPGAPLGGALAEAVLAQCPFGVALFDRDGRLAAANAAYERHWGIRVADVPGDYSLLRDPQLEAAGLLPLVRRAYAGEHVVLPPVRYDAGRAVPAAAGRAVWTQGHCYPLRDAGGAVAHVAITFLDVTEHERLYAAERKARAEVEELNARLEQAVADLEAVLEVVPVGIGIARDPACREIRVNPAFARQLGVVAGANASKSAAGGGPAFRVLQDGREVPPDELVMQRAARERRTIAGQEYDIEHPDGRAVRLLEYAAPLLDPAGEVRGAVGAFVDITDRARLVEAERQARAEAERANRAKSEFLAVMSHELRTPLNAIGGYAELMAMEVRGPVTEQQREDLERIQRSQRHLLGLINEVLNYARLETGSVRYDLRPVGVAGAVAAVESLVLPQAREKAIALDAEPCDPHLAVRADREKLQQVLVNLLSNAIKFTDRGGRVTVTCRPLDDPAHAPRVAVAVHDTGIGIPADKLEAVFEPFVQVGRALNNPTEGTGLGLAISRDLARGMGGDLAAESEPGVGSTFTLVLPREA